jgi:hypothetical protein
MRKRSASRTRRPPPSLDGYRILYFAIVKRPVKYSGHSYLFIDGKELGPVPRLVIGESLEDSEVAILHADASWHVLGVQTEFNTVRNAKERAERMYPGSSSAWIEAEVSRREAKDHEHQKWEPFACSFCGKTPPEFKGPSISSDLTGAVICHLCVHAIQEEFENK